MPTSPSLSPSVSPSISPSVSPSLGFPAIELITIKEYITQNITIKEYPLINSINIRSNI